MVAAWSVAVYGALLWHMRHSHLILGDGTRLTEFVLRVPGGRRRVGHHSGPSPRPPQADAWRVGRQSPAGGAALPPRRLSPNGHGARSVTPIVTRALAVLLVRPRDGTEATDRRRPQSPTAAATIGGRAATRAEAQCGELGGGVHRP